MTEQQVSEEEAIVAAGKCDTIEAALQMLQQECQLCMNVMKITEVCQTWAMFLPPFLPTYVHSLKH